MTGKTDYSDVAASNWTAHIIVLIKPRQLVIWACIMASIANAIGVLKAIQYAHCCNVLLVSSIR